MFIAVDIGNNSTKIAKIDNAKVLSFQRISNRNLSVELDKISVFLTSDPVSVAVIASVNPLVEQDVVRFIKEFSGIDIFILGKNVPLAIKVNVNEPSKVGIDRLVNAIAAFHRYSSDAIIIDMGSAVTIDYVSRLGAFEGGCILPGISMASTALHDQTQFLPLVRFNPQRSVLGKDTTLAIQSGLFWSFIYAIEGIVGEIKKQTHSDPSVVLTGGDACLLKDKLPSVDDFDEYLTLRGIDIVSKQRGLV